MTEEFIIKGCLQKNPLAQRELYNLFSSRMMSVCFRFAQNREDAEDMLQEGLVKVFSQIHTFQGKGSFEGWIRRIIVHTCINFLKRNKKFKDYLNLENAYNLEVKEESIASIMQAKQVIDCIRLLPLGYRTVLNLYAIEGYSHKEVGELLDIGESTSRSQYTRAKVLLENILIQKRVIEPPKENFNQLAIVNKQH